MTLNVRPIGDRILVEPIEEKKENGKKGGIIIPLSKYWRARVRGVIMLVDWNPTLGRLEQAIQPQTVLMRKRRVICNC